MPRCNASENTISKLEDNFAIHVLLRKLDGPSFTRSTFKNFIEKNGITHFCSAPYHPSTNGLEERTAQTFK